jgi:hypothetical protein
MNDATDRVSSRSTCSLPVEVMDASGATAASVRMERTWRLTWSSASFFSSAVIVIVAAFGFLDLFLLAAAARAAAEEEENALASLNLTEETAARARARSGAHGGLLAGAGAEAEGAEEEVDDDEEVEVDDVNESGNDADDDDAIAKRPIGLRATAAGGPLGAGATRDVTRRAETAGRAAVGVVLVGEREKERERRGGMT